jgi:hypothetical protein
MNRSLSDPLYDLHIFDWFILMFDSHHSDIRKRHSAYQPELVS